MSDEETVIAEKTVAMERAHDLKVRISQHRAEDFWRVDVCSPSPAGRCVSTTVAPGDSFMMHLITDAVDGEPMAWRHLAKWGQANLGRQSVRLGQIA